MQAREAVITLNLVNGLGGPTIRLLTEALGSPERVFGAAPSQIKQILGRYATETVLSGIREMADGKALEQEVRRASEAGIRILTQEDDDYPKLLKEIWVPPPVLYVKGTLLPEDQAAVAVVGTRAATPYGLDNAEWFGEELARSGVTVVSGLAEGIDRAAHEGALKGGGRTIAVVGHGLSMIYPRQHAELAERIAKSGCILSEFPMGMPPAKENFPRRNRIISGMSLGVVVVEAPTRSGALITAREALEQGREVFAMPGPISSLVSRGTHDLLKDGAKMVCQVRDIMEELAPRLRGIVRASTLGQTQGQTDPAGQVAPGETNRQAVVRNMTSEEWQVFQAVPVGAGTGLENIARTTTLQPARILSVLTGLELKGLVRQTVGRGFSRPR